MIESQEVSAMWHQAENGERFEITVINHGWDEQSQKEQQQAKEADLGDEYETHEVEKCGSTVDFVNSSRSDRMGNDLWDGELSLSDHWGYELIEIEISE